MFWECAVRCSMRNTSAQVLEQMRMDGLHGLMNSLTLKLLLSCPPLSSTATCGLTHRPRNTHHKVVHFNPQLIPSFSPSKAHEINSSSWGLLSGNKAGSWNALQLAGGPSVDHSRNPTQKFSISLNTKMQKKMQKKSLSNSR